MTPQPSQVIYIAGSGRSGSTLVERALGEIPGWVNVGELIELFRKPSVADERCGCGRAFLACPFWSEVGRLAFGSWSPETLRRIGALQRQASRQRLLPKLLARREDTGTAFDAVLAEYGEFYRKIYGAVAEVAEAEVVVDASKWPGQALALQRLGFPIRLLHLVRDPRGVAYSWSKTKVVRPHGGEGAVMTTHSTRATAFRWAAFQTEIALIRPTFEASARLRYEDFVNDPHGRLHGALNDLGLSEYADGLAHVSRDEITLSESHGVAGNPSRFEHGVVAVRADEAWRTKLPRSDQRLVTAMTAPWLVKLGYPVRTPDAPPAPAAAPAEVTSWPTVAVVLPTRGRPELLREAVESVLDQDYAGEIDLLVVHDQEELQTELKELASAKRSVRLLSNTHAPGLAGARNTGLDDTRADYIASCDDDDFWDTDKLRLQMVRMLAEPDLVVLGAGIRLLMGENQIVEWPGDAPEVTRADLLRSRRKELHSSTLLVRRHVYDAVGGYDELLPSSYAEDYEFLLRAVELGRIGVINTPLASIRKYNASWFRERAEVVAEALEYVLALHPQITESRAGHARVLGQIAFARSLMGERTTAIRLAAQAFSRWPVAPHAALALIHATTGVDPRLLLNSTRKVGRGIT